MRTIAPLFHRLARQGACLGLLALFTSFAAAAEAPVAVAPTHVPPELFSAPDDLEVTLWATSPLLQNPTNMDVDKDGRIWVAEGVNYRGHAGRRKEGDRIIVIEDTNGDGKADSSHVFVQETNLVAPLGVAVLGNKIVVSQPPDLIVYTDVDGDRKFNPAVDKREVLLTGFNGRNHDHSLHSVTAGPNGLWYFNQGNTGAQFTDRSGRTFRIGSPYNHPPGTKQVVDATEIAGQKSDDGRVWIGGFSARMNPDGTGVAIIGHNYRNSYEQAITSFGDLFQSDNDDPPACRVSHVLEYGNAGFASADGKRAWRADMRPGQTIPIAEWRQEDPGTMPAGDVYGGGSPTGVAFYENGALGKKWQGMLLACEAGRNVVFGYFPKPDGAGFKLERFDFLTSNKEKKWAGSDFLGGGKSVNNELLTLFRPSDVMVGVDGAIYVADWFDGRVGGHSDLDNSTSGSIYRIAPKGFKPRIPRINLATTAGQIEALKSPAVNVRNSGYLALKAQGEKAISQVAALLANDNPYIAARAVWLLPHMGPVGERVARGLLKSRNEMLRLTAFRAFRQQGAGMADLIVSMANDSSPAIRREGALACRNLKLDHSLGALSLVTMRFDGRDRSYLEALGLGAAGYEAEIYRIALNLVAGNSPSEKWTDAMGWLAWRLHPAESVPALKARALSREVSGLQRKLMMDALAFVNTSEAATAMMELASTKDFPYSANAMWWLFNRKDNNWRDFNIADSMKQRGLYDPEKVQLAAVTMPEASKEASKLPPVAEILKLKGDVNRGKSAVIVCYTCHQIGSQGTEFGPDLTMFGKTQTRETIINSMIAPSAEISHGYEGSLVETKDGIIINGMVLSNGDPVIIKSMAGLVQTVPRSRVKSNKRLDVSLMFSADMLGLDAQTLADITAFLQSNEVK
jgi:putative membrane-bound dehydrogenase-like protein